MLTIESLHNLYLGIYKCVTQWKVNHMLSSRLWTGVVQTGGKLFVKIQSRVRRRPNQLLITIKSYAKLLEIQISFSIEGASNG